MEVTEATSAVAGFCPGFRGFVSVQGLRKGSIVNPIKLETGLRPNSAGITYTLLLRIEAMGFPTLGLLLYTYIAQHTPNAILSIRARIWVVF